jgi:hypothetical protein
LKTILLYSCLLLWPCLVICQDTSFLTKHVFSTPVRNVFTYDRSIYVKTGQGLYKLEGSKWELQKMTFEKPYVFFDNGFFEADYLPNKYIFNAESMSYLIPQKSISNASKADLNNRFFVSAGGSLYEYAVNNNYKHFYGDFSIRDIFFDEGFKVISSYSGIFINDTIKAKEPGYSNGYLSKIRNKYYLSADHLYEFTPPADFRKIPAGDNVFAGYARKLTEYQKRIYSLNTKSVNICDSNFDMQPIHQGFEYYDLEAVGDKLLFCTNSGELFMYDGNKVRELVHLNTRIRDIYPFKNTVYLSSDDGVYMMQGLDPRTLSQLTKTPYTVMVLIDPLRNTWISTENGLFVLPENKKEPILYVKDVEFNRGALTYYNDDIYAGSISGLYVINSYHVVKNFLPVYFNKKQADNTSLVKKWTIFLFGVVALLVMLILAYRAYNGRKTTLFIPHKDANPVLTLDQIAEAIKTNNIMTVEGLAEFYKTNTVQLNRQFKVFETTPGKFMKTIKINYARELLKNKVPMEDVVAKVGYSAGFIRKELQG